MKKESQLHDLLYLNEHQTCYHYMSEIESGFIYDELKTGEIFPLRNLSCNHLLLFLEGSCTLSYNQFIGHHFGAGEMVLLPGAAEFQGTANEDLKLLYMSFKTPMNGCDKLLLQNFQPYCTQIQYDFRPLPLRYPLDAFAEQLSYCLRNGINCAHFHELKHKELFFYLRGFYTKEEIAELFYPIIGQSFDFRKFVVDNYRKVHTLQELIELSNMSRNTFIRKFKTEFGITAKQWMLKQTCQRMAYAFTQPEATVKEVMVELGFDSPSNFNRFCKANFQCAPSELLRRYRENPDWFTTPPHTEETKVSD